MTYVSTVEDDFAIKKSAVVYKKNQKVRRVLSYLYQEGASTLAQLAELVDTSVPSITEVVEHLINERWVIISGTATGNNGRRPALFGLNPDGHYVVVLDSTTHVTSLDRAFIPNLCYAIAVGIWLTFRYRDAVPARRA